MPKATLEFDLPEEKDEFTLATKGLDLWCFMVDMERHISELAKQVNIPTKEMEIYENIRDTFYELMDIHNISIDMVS